MAASLGTLHKPSTAAVLDRLEREAPTIARRMALATQAEVKGYGAVRDPRFVDEVLDHAAQHVHAFVAAGRAGRPPEGDELDFVRERGAQRARELMPLDNLLEAYLIGQRTVWEAIVETAGDAPEGMRIAQELTALTFGYTHAINVAIAHAYLRESEALASEAERGRRDLLDRLLSGREPGPEEARRAEALGVAPGADLIVVCASAAGGGEEEATGPIVRALIRQEPRRPFVVARHGEVVAITPAYVRRGPRELRAALERMASVLQRTHGIELRAGLSSICSGLSEVARGYVEAGQALRRAGGDAAVVALEEIGLFDYLAASADDTARRLLPAGTEALMRADERLDGALAATLRAYADCDLNVARAAGQLIVHPNTVHYRLRRVQELSGRDPRRFADLVELTAALRLLGRGR
jgi:PucR C-terminal helix-turn-helix domain/GGDEF-like domain